MRKVGAHNVSGATLGGEPVRKVKKALTAKDPKGYRPPSPQFNTSLAPVEKPDPATRTKKKKKVGGGGLSSMPMRQQNANSSSLSDLQSVEEFRHFLLRNDSQFTEYVNSSLLLSIFDSHLMREGMISTMAQVLGSGQTKDNFFLQTR